MFLNEAVGTGFLGCEGVLRHDPFFFGKTTTTAPGLQCDGTREVLPSHSVFPNQFLGMATSRYLNASCLDDPKKKEKKTDFHRNEQKRETTLRIYIKECAQKHSLVSVSSMKKRAKMLLTEYDKSLFCCFFLSETNE